MEQFNLEKFRKALCCACTQSMRTSPHINMVFLDKEATWDHPSWGNILVRRIHPEKRALAIVCDRCVEEKRDPLHAVEYKHDPDHPNMGDFIYHEVQALRDLAPITEQEIVEEADRERRLRHVLILHGGG